MGKVKLFQPWALFSIRAHFSPWFALGKPPPTHCPAWQEHLVLWQHRCLQCCGPPDAPCHPMAGQGRSKLWLLAQQMESWAAEYQACSRRPQVFKQSLEICYQVFYFQQGKNYTLLIFFLLSCWQCDTRMSTGATPDSCQVRSGEDLVQTHAVTGNSMSWFIYLPSHSAFLSLLWLPFPRRGNSPSHSLVPAKSL